MRGHALLKSHRWFILYDGGIDAEACSHHLGGGRFDSCLSLRDSAQPSVLSWQRGGDKMIQLKHGGVRLRVISVQRSSLTRPDSGTEVVDEWNRRPIIIWRQQEKYAAVLANSVYTVLYFVKGKQISCNLISMTCTQCVFAFVVHYYEIQNKQLKSSTVFCKAMA